MALKKLILLLILISTVGSHVYADSGAQLRLRGVVKRSSLVRVADNQNGISYFHNSRQGTRITIDGKSFEYHSPGKFEIPLDKKRHSITIQTI